MENVQDLPFCTESAASSGRLDASFDWRSGTTPFGMKLRTPDSARALGGAFGALTG
jgi:hypothetical protein